MLWQLSAAPLRCIRERSLGWSGLLHLSSVLLGGLRLRSLAFLCNQVFSRQSVEAGRGSRKALHRQVMRRAHSGTARLAGRPAAGRALLRPGCVCASARNRAIGKVCLCWASGSALVHSVRLCGPVCVHQLPVEGSARAQGCPAQLCCALGSQLSAFASGTPHGACRRGYGRARPGEQASITTGHPGLG